jgi:hypothetical protein
MGITAATRPPDRHTIRDALAPGGMASDKTTSHQVRPAKIDPASSSKDLASGGKAPIVAKASIETSA